jgi:hypothetical protein
MGLQLLDLRSSGHHLASPMPLGQADGKGSINRNGNAVHLEDVTIRGHLLDPDKFLALLHW